ncbi:MAG: transcription termination/antitermination protein NusA, partial [Microcystaceae cyanobacterium]
IVSRAAAGLVVELFTVEVPEIEEEIVRIVAVSREANPPSRHVGPRTKIAVDTLERDVDPVGACIGARGSRIQAVVNELRGEKIDAIRWSPDPATYIGNALSPARVDQVHLINAEERHALVIVAEDQLSLAIGKEGQNVRLAARLTGWKIDIKDPATYAREKDQIEQAIQEAKALKEAQAAAALAEEQEFDDLEEDDFEEEELDNDDSPDLDISADSDVSAIAPESQDLDNQELEVQESEAQEPEADADEPEADEEEA